MDLFKTSVENFLAELASDAPTPGGGSVAGLCGAMGAALASMVANLTIGKEKYAAAEARMKEAVIEATRMRGEYLSLAARDMEVFSSFMTALRMPKDTPELQAARTEALDVARREATNVPLEMVELSVALAELASGVLANGNSNAASDAVAAVQLAKAAAVVASYNVSINLAGMKGERDAPFVADVRQRTAAAMARIDGFAAAADARMKELFGA